jgi:GNAT superfamily N-acetyltransferase
VPDELAAAEFRVEDRPDSADIEVLETQIRHEASAVMGLGDEAELAIFVRDAGRVVAGISGWTWGDCCELQSLWVEPSLRGRGLATRLIAAAEAEAAARGCSQTVHFTYAFQARALYERNGYELVGRVEDFPSGTHVLWYRKHLTHPSRRPAGHGPGPTSPARTPPP